MKDCKFILKALIGPGLVWLAGLVLVFLFAPKTVYLNGMVAFGLLLLCLGTFWAIVALCREYSRCGKDWPFFLEFFMPDYPVVEDKTDLMRRLSAFRSSYSDFLSSEREEENSSLQDYASQMMWHSTALQKKRLLKNRLTLEMDSERRAYSGKGSCVRVSKYFDGRRHEIHDFHHQAP